MSDSAPPAPRGPLIAAKDDLLFRQVHPKYMNEGRFTPEVFLLSSSDYGLLSVAHAAKTSAEDAYRRHIKLGRASVAVVAVSVSECEEYAVPAYEDPTNDDAAHAVIDHRAFLPDDKKKERRRIRELLALKADERGIAYRPD